MSGSIYIPKGVGKEALSFKTKEVYDSDYTVLERDRLIVFRTLTAQRSLILPEPRPGVQRVFQVADQSGLAGNFNIIVSADNSTINGMPAYPIRAAFSDIVFYTDGVSYYTGILSENAGQVKINTGNGVKPTLIWTGADAGTFKSITYDYPLGLSGSPTTTFPKNVTNPGQIHVYDEINETLLENGVPGQLHGWRIIYDYSGKSAGAEVGTETRMRNLLSGFSLTQTVYIPSERTSGQFSVVLYTIADAASLPAPFGTGQGYVLDLAADDPITVEVNSTSRFSFGYS